MEDLFKKPATLGNNNLKGYDDYCKGLIYPSLSLTPRLYPCQDSLAMRIRMIKM
jgi:hypothetical protein